MSIKNLNVEQIASKLTFTNLFLTEATTKNAGKQNLSEKQFGMIKTFLNRIKKLSQAQISLKSYYSDKEIALALASGELKLYFSLKDEKGNETEFNYVSEQFFRQNQTLMQFEQFKGKNVNIDLNRKEMADLLSVLIQKAYNVASANGSVKIVRPTKAKAEKANSASA
jgi:hypothetical protein